MKNPCILLLAAALIACRLGADDEPLLLFAGEPFHGDEVTAVSGSRWLALYKAAEGFELSEVSISVSLVNDAVVDSDEEATGKLVTVSSSPQPVVLIPLALGLREGAVDHAAAELTLVPGEERVIAFHDARYVLKVSLNLTPEGTCLVTVEDGPQKQTLARLDQCDEDTYPRLLWSGDLNHDDRLDLLLEASGHYNVSDVGLYLSVATGGKELVRRVAHLKTVGC